MIKTPSTPGSARPEIVTCRPPVSISIWEGDGTCWTPRSGSRRWGDARGSRWLGFLITRMAYYRHGNCRNCSESGGNCGSDNGVTDLPPFGPGRTSRLVIGAYRFTLVLSSRLTVVGGGLSPRRSLHESMELFAVSPPSRTSTPRQGHC